jgi:sulfate permease, SulP family
MNMLSIYLNDLKKEFDGYNMPKLSNDIMAGLTVAAVALPLALAFAISSGADASAGLITAVIAGLLIGGLSGASYQISGPTGAMAAILISLVLKYQIQGMFIATLVAGIILVLASLFKFGKLVSLIPAPVITGFTSGIAIIIALGQLDNFFGVASIGESTISKFLYYFQMDFNPNYYSIAVGILVILIMIFWPKKWNEKIPASLLAIIASLIATVLLKWDIKTIGEIPKALLSANRLHLNSINISEINQFIIPGISIAALGMIESLLCGASAGKMKGEKLNADRELLAQGIGNIFIPFFGGVPATAAIARTSVAIKSGAETRLTGIFHAIFLIISIFFLSPMMSKIPLSALAGVLIMTAWKMNEWSSIKFIFNKKFKTAIFQFLITMLATVIFDLSIAILIGIIFSSLLFIIRISDLEINASHIDISKLNDNGILQNDKHLKTRVIYITGPIFFTTVEKLSQEITKVHNIEIIIFSMRGVPLIDTTGVQFFSELYESLKKQNVQIMFAGVHPKVKTMMERSGFVNIIGEDSFFWNVTYALEKIKN